MILRIRRLGVRILPCALEVGDATEPNAQSVGGPRIRSEPGDTMGECPPDWFGDRVALRQHIGGSMDVARAIREPIWAHTRQQHSKHQVKALFYVSWLTPPKLHPIPRSAKPQVGGSVLGEKVGAIQAPTSAPSEVFRFFDWRLNLQVRAGLG